MDWVKQCKLPACEAIQYNGVPCNDLDSLWGVLHDTYNSASGWVCDTGILSETPIMGRCNWAPFSWLELDQALSICSKNSAPGLDHVMWSHLKTILVPDATASIVLMLADACFWVGYWSEHFKESVLV